MLVACLASMVVVWRVIFGKKFRGWEAAAALPYILFVIAIAAAQQLNTAPAPVYQNPQQETNAIGGAILTELQDTGSPLAKFYLGAQIQEGVLTVSFRSGAETYLNDPDTDVSPVKNDLLKTRAISLVRWEVDGKLFAKFTK